MPWSTTVSPTTQQISMFLLIWGFSSGNWRLKTHDGRVISYNYHIYMFTFQLGCGGAILLYRVVLHGQVGPAVDPVRDDDDRRPVLHLLHLRPRG